MTSRIPVLVCFFRLTLGLIFNYPHAIVGSSIELFDEGSPSPHLLDDGSPSPQTAKPRGGWLERTREVLGATTRKLQGL